MFCLCVQSDGRDHCSGPHSRGSIPSMPQSLHETSSKASSVTQTQTQTPEQKKESTRERRCRCAATWPPCCPRVRRLSHSPLAFPPRLSPPLPAECPSWPSPPPRPPSRSPSSFSRPKKTHECGAVTGTRHRRATSRERPPGSQGAPRCRPGSRFWFG